MAARDYHYNGSYDFPLPSSSYHPFQPPIHTNHHNNPGKPPQATMNPGSIHPSYPPPPAAPLPPQQPQQQRPSQQYSPPQSQQFIPSPYGAAPIRRPSYPLPAQSHPHSPLVPLSAQQNPSPGYQAQSQHPFYGSSYLQQSVSAPFQPRSRYNHSTPPLYRPQSPSGYYSDSELANRSNEHHHHRHHHHKKHGNGARSHNKDKRSRRKQREGSSQSNHSNDGLIGAAGGGLIGDMIFPGLGTLGGVLAGYLAGSTYEEHQEWKDKKRKQMKRASRKGKSVDSYSGSEVSSDGYA